MLATVLGEICKKMWVKCSVESKMGANCMGPKKSGQLGPGKLS